jgi:thioesterase domain-containing protein
MQRRIKEEQNLYVAKQRSSKDAKKSFLNFFSWLLCCFASKRFLSPSRFAASRPGDFFAFSRTIAGMDTDVELKWLTRILTSDIPLGGAMAIRIERLDSQGIALHLPLAPNINDKGTAFGGAMASAMILAGWSLPRLLLKREQIDADLVIGRCEMRFLKPVSGPFEVVCDWPEQAQCRQFVDDLRAKGRGRLAMEPVVMADEEVAARLSARYAALQRPS